MTPAGAKVRAKVWLLASFALALPAMSAAEEAVLLTLRAAGDAEIELEISDEQGLQLADPPVAATVWRLEPGDSVSGGEGRPPDRLVELYTGTPRAPNLFARVVVRYFAQAAEWTPHFLLQEQPLVARINGRWRPFALPGAAGLLVRHGNTLPNADGFFPELAFGRAGSDLPIVAWRVRPPSPVQTVP